GGIVRDDQLEVIERLNKDTFDRLPQHLHAVARRDTDTHGRMVQGSTLHPERKQQRGIPWRRLSGARACPRWTCLSRLFPKAGLRRKPALLQRFLRMMPANFRLVKCDLRLEKVPGRRGRSARLCLMPQCLKLLTVS